MFFKANKRLVLGSRHGRHDWPISSSLPIFHRKPISEELLQIAYNLFLRISFVSIVHYHLDKLWFCNDQLRLSAIPLKIILPCTREVAWGNLRKWKLMKFSKIYIVGGFLFFIFLLLPYLFIHEWIWGWTLDNMLFDKSIGLLMASFFMLKISLVLPQTNL